MKASAAQTSFLGGEWSLTAQGRFDLPQYKTAMNVCLNGLPIEPGLWTRRPGTAIGAFTRGGASARVIKWDFQESAPYTMEFTDGYLRFFAGQNLAVNADTQTVSGISSANPAVVHTGGAHGWTTGQQFIFQNLSAVDPYLLNRTFVGTVTDSTHLSLTDAVTGTTLDGSLLQTFGTGTIARVIELTTPYTGGIWGSLRVVQNETDATLLQGATPPQQIVAVPPAGATEATFTLTPAQFVDGPYLDPVAGATITPASVSGIVGFTIASPTWSSSVAYNVGDYVVYSGTTYISTQPQNLNLTPGTATYAWTAIAQDKVIGPSGLQTSDIGRHIRLFSEPAVWASGTTYAAGANVKYNLNYWTAVVGSNTGNVPGADATKWALAKNAAQWTWGIITSLTGATSTLIAASAGTPFSLARSDPTQNQFSSISQAFDNIISQPAASCAFINQPAGFPNFQFSLGQNYGGSPQSVSYAFVYGPSNQQTVQYGTPGKTATYNLRGKSSAPANTADGTLLGSVSSLPTAGEVIQIFSNDASTTYQYLWIEIVADTSGSDVANVAVAEVQFFTTGSFSGTGISAQIIGPALLSTNPITTWRLGALTLGTYPTCGTFHEGRLWLAGLASNRLDASSLIDINGNPTTSVYCFSPTLQTGTVSDSSAISYKLNGPDVNAIFWLQPDQQGILAGTQAGEWLVQATTLNSPLSPLNMQAHRVTKIGCANIEPRRTEHTNVLVQKHQHKIIEYFADIFSGKFTAPNLSEYAKHLSNRGLAEIAYQQELAPFIWARCNDGSLIGCTYKRDTLMTSQGPTFMGWHRHILGSGRTVESITVGPSAANARDAAGTLDTLAMVTSDGIYRQVEFLTNIFEETRAASDAWFVDSGIVGTTTQAVTSGGRLGMQVSGLWRLNGLTCAVVCGGYDCGDFAVAGGKTFVPYTNDPAGIFTQAFATAATQTIVGFTYTSDGQRVRQLSPEDSGARTGPALGKKRRTNYAAFLFNQTQGITTGVDFTAMNACNFTTQGGTAYAVNALYSGVYWATLTGGDSYDSMIAWRITRPYPATIAAVEGFVETKDL